MKRRKKKKSIAVKIRRLFVVLSVIALLAWIAIYSVNYTIGEDEVILNADGTVNTSKSKKTRLFKIN